MGRLTMEFISFTAAFGTVLWTGACLFAVITIWKRRKTDQFFPEHILLTVGILLLAIAPCVALIVFAFGETTSFLGGGIQIVFALILFGGSYRARRHRLNPTDSESSMSFREKSSILVLAALVVVFLGYFARTLGATLAVAIPEFIGSVVLLILIMIVGHIVIAVYHSPLDEVDEAMDERDSAIELRSVRNAYYTMVIGFWAIPVLLILSFPALIIANTWFAILVLSEVVKYGSVVAYYRFGEL